MDLINSVSNKGLETSLLIGDVLMDCQGVRPKGDTEAAGPAHRESGRGDA